MTVSRTSWPYPQLAAHRGAGKLAPENTLTAIRLGASFGYRMVEFDVKLSADNVLFLMHDPTLERTTSGRGRAAGATWAQLSQLDAGSWHSPGFSGEPLPTYSNVLQYCRKNGIAVNAEIKSCPGREFETGAAVALETRVVWGEGVPSPLLSSFSDDALAGARRAVPSLPRALLMNEIADDWLARCRALECVAIDVNWKALTADFVAAAHAADLAVVCYTCNDAKAVAQLVKMGVNTIITDEIGTILP